MIRLVAVNAPPGKPVWMFLLVCLQLLAAGSVSLVLAEIEIPFASDFAADGRISNNIEAPILLYFSAPDCRYCMKLEEAVLKPMLRSGDYDGRVLLRRIDWLSTVQVDDFVGERIAFSALAERYEVKVTPTLIFVDSRGREVARRILGFRSADFFWYYLDQRIKESRIVIKAESAK
jgi:thioredoxin-related protein